MSPYTRTLLTQIPNLSIDDWTCKFVRRFIADVYYTSYCKAYYLHKKDPDTESRVQQLVDDLISDHAMKVAVVLFGPHLLELLLQTITRNAALDYRRVV